MPRIYIGIDNGLSGALVALAAVPAAPLAMAVMPSRGKDKGNEIDPRAMLSWLRGLYSLPEEFAPIDLNEIAVVIETPGKFSKGVMAISSMWDSYGATRAVLECGGYRHHRITPAHWQKAMLPGCARGDTKNAARQRARQLWPDTPFLATDRSSKPHEGLIDAALIAEYARIKQL